MFTALKKDKLLRRPSTIVKILRELGGVLYNVGPFALRALSPAYNPRQEHDPEWYKNRVAGHARLGADAELPLVDTTNPDMPVPFENVA